VASKSRFGCLSLALLVGVLIWVVQHNDSNVTPPPVAKEDRVQPSMVMPKTTLDDLKLDYKWWKDEFSSSIMTATFTIRNDGPLAVKDVEITCRHTAGSGTEIDSNTRTIYEVVKAHSKRRFPNFNMGFIHSQATKSACSITDFKMAE
jgi:hypothetical protein